MQSGKRAEVRKSKIPKYRAEITKNKQKYNSTNLDKFENWLPGSLQSTKVAEGRKAKVQKKHRLKRTKMQKHKSTTLDTSETWPPGSLQSGRAVQEPEGQHTLRIRLEYSFPRLRREDWN